MVKTLSHFLKDEYGATAVEYVLIAPLIAIALITGPTGFSFEQTV